MSKKSKKYQKFSDNNKGSSSLNSIEEIIDQLIKSNEYKFDQTVEIKFAVSRSKKNNQPYKLSLSYKNNFGKDVKVLFLGEAEDAQTALKAGADYAGLEEYVDKIQKENWFDFDIVIATPGVMPKVARLGKTLGTKGLMPNPKNGTVATDVEKTIAEFKQGKRNFKEDKTGVIHAVVGKASMGNKKILENTKDLYNNIKETQGLTNDIKSINLKFSMSPSYEISLNMLESM
jgi:large subunit ribosomal protein L1